MWNFPFCRFYMVVMHGRIVWILYLYRQGVGYCYLSMIEEFVCMIGMNESFAKLKTFTILQFK